jgi:hypothetical protein
VKEWRPLIIVYTEAGIPLKQQPLDFLLRELLRLLLGVTMSDQKQEL